MKDETGDSGTTIVMGCLVMLLLMVPGILWRGWIFAKLWAWFVMPLGAPSIRLLHAFGLMVLVSFATAHLESTSGKSGGKAKSMGTLVAEQIGYAFLGPALALAAGYAVHQMM